MKPKRLLIVDDDDAILFSYKRYLTNIGYQVATASSLKEAKSIVSGEKFDASLLDMNLPDGISIDSIPEFKANNPDMTIIVITGAGDIPKAVQAIKNGAENFLTKPVSMEDLKITLEKCIEIGTLRRRNSIQQRLMKNDDPYFGNTKIIADLLHYANVAAVNDTIVLLLGETGVGKGVLARWIHNQSERRKESFVELNCSSLRGELLKSELFGHGKGSFTSAIKDREGLIEVADRGTLFLDEIGDMDLEVQAQLLKTIEERTFRRIGENHLRKSDFRLICATHRDLLKEIQSGRFRQDFFYRICVFPITIPPLRERAEDMAGLCEHILTGFGYSHFPLASEVIDFLTDYNWPGNFRELRNMLERACLLAQGKPIGLHDFPGLCPDPEVSTAINKYKKLEDVEDAHILKILRENNGDKLKASKALDISLSTLYRKLISIEKKQ